MNSLTAKFLSYRSKPQEELKPFGPQLPKMYPIEGFISNTETSLERMGRLVEAYARGEWFSPENKVYYSTHLRIGTGVITPRTMAGFNAKQARDELRNEREYEAIRKTTAPMIRCG